MNIHVPKDHPRFESIRTREKLVESMDTHILAPAGLIAHGRGEAFDYLLGERTPPPSSNALIAAAATLLRARHPVLSVNGNVAALCPDEIVELSRVSGAALEVNLFYRSPERENAIKQVLLDAGASEVLGIGNQAGDTIPEIGSERRRIDQRGIGSADVVFVPLEDGDRTEGLVAMGKTVITVDLNPLSRTSRKASITIVDNITRAVPLLTAEVRHLVHSGEEELDRIFGDFDNQKNLRSMVDFIIQHLKDISFEGV